MEKRFQIFVSSTYSDLRDEREKVIHELTRIGYIAVGMEQFPATDEEQLEYIQKIIDESDYYVVIVRGKYGSLASDGISFTEKECDYALETKKPVLAFLFKNPGQLKVDETDDDPEKAQKLSAFKRKLEERRIVKYWESGEQLTNDIKDSIHGIVRRRPGIGWIRGDQALDPKIYKELDDVQRQNKELREKLDRLGKEDITFPAHLAQGEDLFEIEYKVLNRVNNIEEKSGVYKISWDTLFAILGGSALAEQDEWDIQRIIHHKIAFEESIDDTGTVQMWSTCTRQARYQFEALGLVKAIATPNSGGSGIRWTLTNQGRRYLSNLSALKRPSEA
jgi:Domain of unknown function (DUF4062)